MRYDNALTKENFTNPYLININIDETITIDGNLLTAEYIWGLNEAERLALIEKIKAYYKNFPTEKLTKDYMNKQFKKLKLFKPNSILDDAGKLKNSSSLCLDITRYYNRKNFYKVEGEKMDSLETVFKNNLTQVLKNRMGWYTSTEDGTERPYVFNITDKMIRQGMRSCGLGFNVSQIKPAVLKYLYHRYAKESVLDYSAGWGARALAAASLNLNYYGIDPLTADDVNRMINDFGKGFCNKGGSEVIESYENIPEVDCCLSCPPYFVLEIYSHDENQSVSKFSEYNEWLEKYWRMTVKNCLTKLKKEGYFILIMIEKYKKYDLGLDMSKILIEEGLVPVEVLEYKTVKNHLSHKKVTKEVTKSSEKVYVFRKRRSE